MIYPEITAIWVDTHSIDEYNVCKWVADVVCRVNIIGVPASSVMLLRFTTPEMAQKFRRAMTDELKDLYNDKDSRLNTVASPDKYNYWRMLRLIRDEWAGDRANLTVADVEFARYVNERYGIKMAIDFVTGGVTADYEIVDEQKYLIAVLKFK